MASQYVPPHLRNRISKAEEVNLKPESFPALRSSAPVRTNAATWTKPKTFASLAREWNDKADNDKLQREIDEHCERSRIKRENMDQRSHFFYSRSGKHYDGFVYDAVEVSEELPQDEWTDVSHNPAKIGKTRMLSENLDMFTDALSPENPPDTLRPSESKSTDTNSTETP